MALLRYRLWDVDVVIRRTLVYGTLVGILALAYGRCSAAAAGALAGLTGPQPGVLIVAITLLLAVGFAPLRGRLQRAVDRRFYRERSMRTRPCGPSRRTSAA